MATTECYFYENRHSGQPFEVVGYAADADTWCPDCARILYPDGVSREGEEVGPIFLDTEWDRGIVCGRCGENIPVSVLESEDLCQRMTA